MGFKNTVIQSIFLLLVPALAFSGNPQPPKSSKHASIHQSSMEAQALPDLRLTNMDVDFHTQLGTVVYFTFDLLNEGEAVALGDYNIGVYLSEGPIWDSTDIEVGIIPTGNTPIGSIEGIVGAAAIPSDAPTGRAYLVIHADTENVIAEANENNNGTSHAIYLYKEPMPPMPGVDECGFLKLAGSYPGTRFQGVSFDTAQEDSTGFSITGTRRLFAPDEIRTVTTNFDLNGNWLSIDDDRSPVPPSFSEFSFVENDPPNLVVQKNNSDGSIAWTTTLSFEDQTPTAITGTKGFELEDGVLVVGTIVDPVTPPLFSLFVIKLSESGDELNRLVDIELSSSELFSLREMYKVNSGYIFDAFQGGVRRGFLGVSEEADEAWFQSYASDLPSNRHAGNRVSKDGNYIYAGNVNNSFSYLEKVDVFTGEEVYRRDLNTLFSAAGGFPFALSNFAWKGLIPTEDGGVVMGFGVYFPEVGESGYFLGKVDEDGNTVWIKNLEETRNFNAMLETSDGGYLFMAEEFQDEQYDLSVMKVTSAGELDPECGADERCDITDMLIEEGPICNEDGTYRICFRLIGQGMPSTTPEELKVVIDHQVVSTSSYTKVGNDVLVCVDSLDADGTNDMEAFVQVEPGCTFTVPAMYHEPSSCGDPIEEKNCDITDVRLEEGPYCDGDATYGICVRVVGQGLSQPPANLKIVVKGVPVTDKVSSIEADGDDQVICISDIPANGAWNVPVFVQWEEGCTLTGYDLYRAPEPYVCQAGAREARVYPNPSQGEFTISGFGIMKASFELRNMLGQVVKQGQIEHFQDIKLDVKAFENGVYILNIRSEEEVETFRIMKQ